MTRLKFVTMLLGLLAANLLAPAAFADKPKNDKSGEQVPGARWEFDVKKRGKKIDEGTFRAHQGKIYHGGTQIGTFSKNGKGDFDLDIAKGKLKGKIHIILVRNDPRPVYAGDFEMAEDGKAKITVKFLED